MNKFEPASEGTYYRAYLQGDDNKHYVIDVVEETCRCIEDATVYRIRRQIETKPIKQIWEEIMKQINKDATDVPWKQPKKEQIIPLPLLDYKKYLAWCPFIDV